MSIARRPAIFRRPWLHFSRLDVVTRRCRIEPRPRHAGGSHGHPPPSWERADARRLSQSVMPLEVPV